MNLPLSVSSIRLPTSSKSIVKKESFLSKKSHSFKLSSKPFITARRLFMNSQVDCSRALRMLSSGLSKMRWNNWSPTHEAAISFADFTMPSYNMLNYLVFWSPIMTPVYTLGAIDAIYLQKYRQNECKKRGPTSDTPSKYRPYIIIQSFIESFS